ncbi:MAG TPA: hypothetical protein VGR38_07205 [Candidatus Polarisedimenticolia bacterium]|nr:hypothetical protein [Candidatus Polarisedimenticolia bacterium]
MSAFAGLALLAFPASPQIAINEIHYHPEANEELEFVELINAGAETRWITSSPSTCASPGWRWTGSS